MDSIRGAITVMARTEYGHPSWVLFHPGKCAVAADIHAGSGWTGMDVLSYEK